VTGLV